MLSLSFCYELIARERNERVSNELPVPSRGCLAGAKRGSVTKPVQVREQASLHFRHAATNAATHEASSWFALFTDTHTHTGLPRKTSADTLLKGRHTCMLILHRSMPSPPMKLCPLKRCPKGLSWYIAVEFAGIFGGLGGDVHLMYRADKVLRGFDEECRAQVTENLAKRDIKVRRDLARSAGRRSQRTLPRGTPRKCDLHPGCNPTKIDKQGDGSYVLHFKDASGTEASMACSLVMMATGRAPKSMNIGLQQVGVSLGPNGAVMGREGGGASERYKAPTAQSWRMRKIGGSEVHEQDWGACATLGWGDPSGWQMLLDDHRQVSLNEGALGSQVAAVVPVTPRGDSTAVHSVIISILPELESMCPAGSTRQSKTVGPIMSGWQSAG
eukprot:1154736-Pelagomonas_calceolata.AAC.2